MDYTSHLDGRSVDIEFLEDGEGFFVEFWPDGEIGDIRGVVVVQTVDVLHHPRSIGLDRR